MNHHTPTRRPRGAVERLHIPCTASSQLSKSLSLNHLRRASILASQLVLGALGLKHLADATRGGARAVHERFVVLALRVLGPTLARIIVVLADGRAELRA